MSKSTRIPLILFHLMLLAILGFAQERDSTIVLPPNCVHVKDNLYIDKTEMANVHWLEYLHYLKRDSSEQVYKEAIPDTAVWLAYDDTLKAKHYLRYPAYQFYPVVGISQDQAISFCKWRSDAVNAIQNIGKTNYRYLFRLPTENEWEMAATGINDIEMFPYGVDDYFQKPTLKDDWQFYYQPIKGSQSIEEENFKKEFKQFRKKGKEPYFNCLKPFDSLFHYGALTPLITVDQRHPNSIGVFDMIGNIAEMVAEEGIAKGGSWSHYFEKSKIQDRNLYEQPAPWLGFRCVCEVIFIEN